MKKINQEDLFPYDLIAHFSYHKCMTSYYQGLMRTLSKQFNFYYQHQKTSVNLFKKELLDTTEKKVLSINNRSDIPFKSLPNYRGSHFLRDPRDLIVSGYKYHLWTNELWCNSVDYHWEKKITQDPLFKKYIEPNESLFPVNIPYKDYINKLGEEKGMILEMIWRRKHFKQMKKWNYKNKNILEVKYEDIIGNEVEAFQKIFLHYGLHPRIIKRGLEIVDKNSLKNKNKSDVSHVRSGVTKQWKSAYSELHKEIFKKEYGDLLILLDYEQDMEW